MASGAHGHVLVERERHVMVVTMNRPERRNALSPEMMRGLARAWDEANGDPDVRVVILTGAGGAFCAGADLRAMSESPPGDAFAAADAPGSGVQHQPARHPRTPEPDGEPSGTSVAHSPPAPEAQRLGLIGEVVPDGPALDRAREVAGTIAANGPVAVQAVLRALRATEGVPERDAMRIDSEIGMAVYASDDAREGPRAFVEKRTPQFTGH